MKFLFVLIGLAVLLSLARLIIPALGNSSATGVTQRDGQSFLGDCPNTPNCVSSEASRKEQRVERLAPINDYLSAIKNLATLVETVPNMTVVQFDDRYLYAKGITPLMQYVDDVEFLLSDDNQSIQVRSASRLGRSDFGANAKRIERISMAAAGKL